MNYFQKGLVPPDRTENQDVVLRPIEIWENLQKTIKGFSSLPKSKKPQCKSYDSLLSYVSDPLMKVKLQFFKDLASIWKYFFESVKPMIQ